MSDTTPANPRLEAALRYASMGFRVGLLHHPVGGRCSCGEACGKNAAKHPRTDIMRGGLTRFTTDPATLKRYLALEPSANLGIEAPPGFAFFDVDDVGAMHADGRAWPATLRQRTAHGAHLLYRVDGLKVVNSVRGVLPYLDVRGPGSYIVAAPSRHVSGALYEWDMPFNLEVVADAPAWLAELLKGKTKRGATRDGAATPGEIIATPDAEAPADKLSALLANDARFRATWNKKRRNLRDKSASGYCLALADTAVRAGLADQETCDLLVQWRREHAADAKPPAWYALTIAKARQRVQPPGEPDPHPVGCRCTECREKARPPLERLRELLKIPGFEVEGAVRRGREWYVGAHYDLILHRVDAPAGERLEVPLGPAAALRSFKLAGDAIFDVTKRNVQTPSKDWQKVTELVSSLATVVETVTDGEEVSGWIEAYFETRCLGLLSIERISEEGCGLDGDGRRVLTLSALKRWAALQMATPTTLKALALSLTRLGWTPEQFSWRKGARIIKTRLWREPRGGT